MVDPLASPAVAAAFVLLAFGAGIGISAVGPGGIFLTIALFLFVPIPPETVAGTASSTFVATGALATALFRRSGEFSEGVAREGAVVLSVAGGVGAAVGPRVNFAVSEATFGRLLAAFVAVVGGIILYRELVGIEPTAYLRDRSGGARRVILGAVGFGVGVLGGLLGVGGPVLAVPALVLLGVPMLAAVAVAQVQSVVLSGVAAAGYWVAGAVSVPLAVLLGVPQLFGVVVGWRLAHRIAERRLRIALGAVLLAIAPWIAF